MKTLQDIVLNLDKSYIISLRNISKMKVYSIYKCTNVSLSNDHFNPFKFNGDHPVSLLSKAGFWLSLKSNENINIFFR